MLRRFYSMVPIPMSRVHVNLAIEGDTNQAQPMGRNEIEKRIQSNGKAEYKVDLNLGRPWWWLVGSKTRTNTYQATYANSQHDPESCPPYYRQRKRKESNTDQRVKRRQLLERKIMLRTKMYLIAVFFFCLVVSLAPIIYSSSHWVDICPPPLSFRIFQHSWIPLRWTIYSVADMHGVRF